MKAELTENQISLIIKFGGLFAFVFLAIFVPGYSTLKLENQLKEQQALFQEYIIEHEEYDASTNSQLSSLTQKLSEIEKKNKKKKADFFNKEVTCLARNIYYESGAEPKEGMLAVAQVTMNRKKAGFARTICGVVYQRTKSVCQFSWVCENKRPPHPRLYKKSYDLARKSLTRGVALDRLHNALYFHADYVEPAWSRQKNFLTQIGAHKFYSERS